MLFRSVASRCGVAQFVLLLPQANYENSRMIADRITKAFARQYPHSPALLRASVHPMQPADEEEPLEHQAQPKKPN